MKNLQILLFSLICVQAFAQSPELPKGIIKIFPIPIGYYQAHYEMPLNNKRSIQVTAIYSTPVSDINRATRTNASIEEISRRKLVIMPEFRRYRNEAPFGRFYGTFGRYMISNENVEVEASNGIDYSHRRSRQNLGIGIMTGKQRQLGRRMTWETYVGIGVGYQFVPSISFTGTNLTVEDYEELRLFPLDRPRLLLRMGINIGLQY